MRLAGGLWYGCCLWFVVGCFGLAESPLAAAQKKTSSAANASPKPLRPLAVFVKRMKKLPGFVPIYWDDRTGKIWLELPSRGVELLYVNSLSSGLGSNPVGLDRGQLGGERLVRFVRVARRMMMQQPNLSYRALSNSKAERRAVAESFASSTLWGFEIVAASDKTVLIDATEFLLRDAHRVVDRLKSTKQGSFKLERSRSFIYLPRTRNFPNNSEIEASLTFSSNSPGPRVRETAPTPYAITLRQHHSFVKLPEAGYTPRRFDPRVGTFKVSFADYSTPIDKPLHRHWITRHRLRRRDPGKTPSPPVKPIVYYVDRAAPQPVRDALIEGARWWNKAFEAAGFVDAFQVRVLPADADPMDIRYNVIQWVHRSTRGWSYGQSVIDPRTGEIIKGHVLLGSLRVRQDHLLIEGLGEPAKQSRQGRCSCCGATGMHEDTALANFDPNVGPKAVALARIRQLSAHEVGHTLGFSHNFAASTYGDRASVMDYPAPRIKITKEGRLDLSDAYGVGVGAWDKFIVQYAYTDFGPAPVQPALDRLVQSALSKDLIYLSDADARPAGAAHPLANLWDNGRDPIAQLGHIMKVRRIGLDRFGSQNLEAGRPWSDLEIAYVPIFLHHRYQVDAVAKFIGGATYRYAIKGDRQRPLTPISVERQKNALTALLATLKPEELLVPKRIVAMIAPKPFRSARDIERFEGLSAPLFDPLAAARVAADMTVANLLQRQRAARLATMTTDKGWGFGQVVDQLVASTWRRRLPEDPRLAVVAKEVQGVVLRRLLELAGDSGAATQVRAVAASRLANLAVWLRQVNLRGGPHAAHFRFAEQQIQRFLNRPHLPAGKSSPPVRPPGSPIGR